MSTQEQERAVARGARWIRVTIVVLAAAFAGQAAFGAWAVLNGARARKETCEVAVEGRDALRLVLIRARAASLRANPGEERRVREFYDPLLAALPPVDCETSGQPKPKKEKQL